MNEELENEFLKDLFQCGKETEVEITSKVMQRIEKSSELFEYQPVISKKVWIIMGSFFTLTIFYLLMQSQTNMINYPALLTSIGNGYSMLKTNLTFNWSGFKIPAINSSVLIAIMAFNVIGVYLIFSYRWSRGIFK